MKLLYIQLGLKPTLNTFSFSSNHTQGDIFDQSSCRYHVLLSHTDCRVSLCYNFMPMNQSLDTSLDLIFHEQSPAVHQGLTI